MSGAVRAAAGQPATVVVFGDGGDVERLRRAIPPQAGRAPTTLFIGVGLGSDEAVLRPTQRRQGQIVGDVEEQG